MYSNLRLTLLFATFSLLIIACRNEPETTGPALQNEVKVRLSSEPENLNFLLTAHASATEIFKLLSMPLASFDPGTYELAPTLIRQMPLIAEVTEGDYKGTVSYDFEILEEAKWDNGSPILAEDFLFTLKAVFNPNYSSPHRSLTSFIKDVQIDPENPKKFRVYGAKYIIAAPVVSNFELMPRYVYDPEDIMANYTLNELKDPANKEQLENDEQLKAFAEQFSSPLHLSDPQGISYAGPYRLERWITGQEIVLVKKDNWWGDQLAASNNLLSAHPQKITFKFIPDINAAVSLAKNGEIDVMGRIEWAKFMELKEDKIITEQYNLHVPEKIAYRFIILNNANPKFEDKKVRQAMDHLFDRKEIGETVYYGFSKPTIGPVHPSKSYYNKNLSVRSLDIEKAKSLLDEAGWKDTNGNGIVDKKINGQQVEMDVELLYLNGFRDYSSMGIIFADAAKKAGVNIIPTSMETKAIFTQLRSKEFDAAFWGEDWYPLHKDLASRYHTRGSQNFGSFSNAESDDLIQKLRRIVDDSQLPPYYMRVQEILHEESPNIFINTGEDRLMVHKKFGDVRVTAVKPHYYLNEFTINQPVPVKTSNN